MKTKLTAHVLLWLGLISAVAMPAHAEIYRCLTWESNGRTVVDIDENNHARCEGAGQVRVATIEAEPYESVELDHNTGFVTTTYLDPYTVWDTYLSENADYAARYRGSFLLNYLSTTLDCEWTCPTPYQDMDSVVPWFDWETHGGLSYTTSGTFSGWFYFY